METVEKSFSRNLKRIRKRRNYSQAFLSQLSGISRVTIVNLERGRCSSATLKTMDALAEALDISVGEFFNP